MGETKLPEWIKTADDYERWKQGEDPSHHQQQPSLTFTQALIIGIAVVVILIGGIFFYIKGTPRYSIYQFRNAMVDGNGEKALKYIDIDSIVDHIMKEALTQQASQPVRDEWEQTGRNFGNMMIAAMLPAMKETLKSSFKTAITSSNKSNLDNLKGGSIWGIHIEIDGHTAIVSNKKDSSFKFRMTRAAEGHWKIVEIITSKDKDSNRRNGRFE